MAKKTNKKTDKKKEKKEEKKEEENNEYFNAKYKASEKSDRFHLKGSIMLITLKKKIEYGLIANKT